jgi:hypothetical protein
LDEVSDESKKSVKNNRYYTWRTTLPDIDRLSILLNDLSRLRIQTNNSKSVADIELYWNALREFVGQMKFVMFGFKLPNPEKLNADKDKYWFPQNILYLEHYENLFQQADSLKKIAYKEVSQGFGQELINILIGYLNKIKEDIELLKNIKLGIQSNEEKNINTISAVKNKFRAYGQEVNE